MSATSTVPANLRTLTGVWRRRSVSIDGDPPTEPATVLWFQVGHHYLDIRSAAEPGPLSGPGVFAGTTSWRPPALTWHHHLDSAHTARPTASAVRDVPPAGSTADGDTGEVSWNGEALVERGSFTVDGRTVGYVEVWERVTPPGAIAVATGRGTYATPGGASRAIRIGDHRGAITVDPLRGAWAGVVEQRTAAGWAVLLTVGDSQLVPDTESAAP